MHSACGDTMKWLKTWLIISRNVFESSWSRWTMDPIFILWSFLGTQVRIMSRSRVWIPYPFFGIRFRVLGVRWVFFRFYFFFKYSVLYGMNNDQWLFFPSGRLSWCFRPLVLRLLVLDPCGVRVDWSSLISCSRRAGYVGEGIWVSHLVFLQRLLNLVSFLQKLCFWTFFLFCILVVKMGFLVFI